MLVNWKNWREDLRSRPIIRAFVISLIIHFTVFFVIEVGRTAGLWKASALPAFARRQLADAKTDPARSAPAEKQEEPPTLQFIEVDPAQAAPEEPKDTQFYSSASTAASNPDTRVDLKTPKIEGQQAKVPKTMDTAKAEPKPVEAPEPKDTLAPNTRAQQQAARTAQEPGETISTKDNTLTAEEKKNRDLTFDKPAPAQKAARPRTLAAAREQKGIIEGPKMRQEGGVKRFSIESNMDVKSSPFGSYDAAFIAAVQARWFTLLDQRDFSRQQSGRVVVHFRLNKDGRITQMRVAENEVSDTLAWMCQRAVQDPAPFAPFPNDLRRLLGTDYREVRFTFHYN